MNEKNRLTLPREFATEWIDRVRTARQDGELRKGSAEAAVLGVGQEFRDRAMSAILAVN